MCDYSNGWFNTIDPQIPLFNKPSEWTNRGFKESEAGKLLARAPKKMQLEYVCFENMTDEEKAAHPEAKTTGGYLRRTDNSEQIFKWWLSLSDSQKETIKAIPNFDKKIFKEITGIDVDYKEDKSIEG